MNKKSQNKIAIGINRNLNFGLSTTVKHLIRLKYSKQKLELPLSIVIELIKTTNSGFKNKIINNFKYFICKAETTNQKIKAVKEINETFAKLIGAFIADGHSKPEGHSYRLKISDGKIDLIKLCSRWIKEVFGFNAIIRFNKKDNTYNCWFNNKIIARYFKNIFKIPSGKKAYIVKEPNLIKNNSLNIRKAFIKGVMSFDGGIKTTGMVALSSKSKQLIYDSYNILSIDKIKVNKRFNKKSKTWLIESKSGRNKEYLTKWLDYFEKGTWKYNRLKFFIENKNYSLNHLNYLFPNHHLSKINLNKVYNSIKCIKSGKINNISKQLKIPNTTIYKYLYILNKAGLIYKFTEKNTDGTNYWSETIYNLK